MKRTALILLLIILMVPFACGKKEVKPESQDSKTAKEAFALAEDLRAAFIRNDEEALARHTDENGFKAVTANKATYDSVELTFTPRWVEIDPAKVMVNITWKSKWTVRGKQLEDRGMAVFVMEGRPLKLSQILRANPFVAPQR